MGRLIKVVGLMMAVVMLLTMSGLASCGGTDESEDHEIRIAILTDFTGPAAYAAKQHTEAFIDYFRQLDEENPIPGVTIKVLTYDQRSNFARVVPGYIWLRGQGAILVHPVSGDDFAMLESRFEADHIPGINAYLSEKSPNHEWTYSLSMSPQQESEVAMQWIMNTWDYAGKGRPPRIGHQGWARESSVKYQAGIERMMDWYPDKFEFVDFEPSPLGTSTWAVEIGKLQGCDYIYVTMVGSMLSSFVREARARGYEGNFVSCTIAFTGFWGLVRSAVPADQLYGCYYAHFVPWWTDDIPYIDTAKEAVMKYHPDDAEQRMEATGPLAAWGLAMFTAEALRNAVEKVGASNVDGVAVRDALVELDMTVEGWDYPWRFPEDKHLLIRDMKVYQWSVTKNTWECVSGSLVPRSLTG